MADTLVTRSGYLDRLAAATRRTPVTSLLGPRQCGKTTLARQFAATRNATFFDLESDQDVRRLANPELVLGVLDGLVVVDEIQRMPQLFNVLRVLADRPGARTRFLILGSASPGIVRGVSESLAGRVEFIDMTGFDLSETGTDAWRTLWLRGGLPRSYLAPTDDDGHSWRRSFVRTFLERDIPQLGITVPAAALERFWTMLAHWHGQTWNASSLGRSMSASDKTVRGYVDLLTGAFMVRQLQPWYQNVAKRQVKAPRIYLRDTGLLHALLGIRNDAELFGHPRVGPSWEGFVIEQILSALDPDHAWFWATHGGGELDLLVMHHGRRIGFEVKFSEAPRVTAQLRNVAVTLGLDHLFVVCPTDRAYPADRNVTVLPVADVVDLPDRISRLSESF